MSLNDCVRIYGFQIGCLFFLAWQMRAVHAQPSAPAEAMVAMVAPVKRRVYGKGPIYARERRAMIRPATVVHGSSRGV